MTFSILQCIVGESALPQDVMNAISVINYADRNHILGQMAHCYDQPPTMGVEDVFNNAKLRAQHDHTMLRFEMDRVSRALQGSGVKAVILKGGAYVARGLKASMGRRVSDLDILVASEDIARTEGLLKAANWLPDEQTDNPYDQQYYRDHMHELPPLRHKTRGTVIDVHHSLLPRTARYQVNVDLMLETSVPIPDQELWTFQPVDIFAHSAIHGFFDGQLDVPARTLVELKLLYDDLSDDEKACLGQRAKEIGAQKAVAMALWAIGNIFDNPRAAAEARALMNPFRSLLLKRALISKTVNSRFSIFAKGYLYLKGHYLRMPIYLLLPHLLRKAARWRPASNAPPQLPTP